MAKKSMKLGGFVGNRFQGNVDQWLLIAPLANPGMMDTFRQREKEPRRVVEVWYGEFPGKYMTSLALAYQMSRDEKLYEMGEYMVREFAEVQSPEGYLGVAPKVDRLSGMSDIRLHPQLGHSHLWDVWSHYHCMYGLWLWYHFTGNEQAKAVCLKTADFICEHFMDHDITIADAKEEHTNMSVIHIFALLYEETKNPRYWDMVMHVEKKGWASEFGGNYLNDALAGKLFYEFSQNRWECLHSVMALPVMFRITGDEKYKIAFDRIWKGIIRLDCHNTGGFSSGERATGDPYSTLPIETCCSIAWNALTTEYLYAFDSLRAADELEINTWNAILGAQHPTGRWWTYNTPMVGNKCASAHSIVFQAYQGSPELNCCSVNGPRGIGMIFEWGVMLRDNQITLNYYGESETTVSLNGQTVVLSQETAYPCNGRIRLTVKTEEACRFGLRLRIPTWSKKTTLTMDGTTTTPASGEYYEILRDWQGEVAIDLELDMSLHFWRGDAAYKDHVSVYTGPVLLTYDQRFNEKGIDQVERINFAVPPVELEESHYPKPLILREYTTTSGKKVALCDFATAGMTGADYTSWFPCADMPIPKADVEADLPLWDAHL